MTIQEDLEKELASLLELQRRSAQILSQICVSIDKALQTEGGLTVDDVRDAHRAVERAAGGMERLVELATQGEDVDPDLVSEALSLNDRFAEAAEKIASTLATLSEAEAERFNS